MTIALPRWPRRPVGECEKTHLPRCVVVLRVMSRLVGKARNPLIRRPITDVDNNTNVVQDVKA